MSSVLQMFHHKPQYQTQSHLDLRTSKNDQIYLKKILRRLCMSTPNFLPIHLLENDTKVKTLLKMYLLNDEDMVYLSNLIVIRSVPVKIFD